LLLASSASLLVNQSVRALVVGCGYVGLPLGIELVRRGHEVYGLRRNNERELKQCGITPVMADITRWEDFAKIPVPFDWVVNTVSSTKGGVEEYRAVYLDATRYLMDWLAPQPVRQYVYTSSTSVYGQTDGSWVTEESPTEPKNETSQVLVETEQLLLNAARERSFPATILRVAGIYGPERGHLFQQFLRGEAEMSGEGSRLINMVHRDDVVAVIIAVLARGTPGRVYNVADDEPVTQQEFFAWLSVQLDMPMPPRAEDANKIGKRGLTNKRVSNRRLRMELDCELNYPTFRQGYLAEIARLKAAGQWPARAGG
jgi:nucleoside-diphosphate-sugar epimerase